MSFLKNFSKREPEKKIVTANGEIEIFKPDLVLLKRLQKIMPFGVLPLEQTVNIADYGIVMCLNEQEVYCWKQQPIKVELAQAEQLFHIQHIMITEAYCRYLKLEFSGAYLAFPYIRQRENGLWEAGVSHFVFPFEIEMKLPEISQAKIKDIQFGRRASKMQTGFLKCFKRAFNDAGITMPQYFGLDVRPRSHLQNLGMNFMILDTNVICLRANLREYDDVSWSIMASAGIKKVFHLPALPITIQKSDLEFAKGVL